MMRSKLWRELVDFEQKFGKVSMKWMLAMENKHTELHENWLVQKSAKPPEFNLEFG